MPEFSIMVASVSGIPLEQKSRSFDLERGHRLTLLSTAELLLTQKFNLPCLVTVCIRITRHHAFLYYFK